MGLFLAAQARLAGTRPRASLLWTAGLLGGAPLLGLLVLPAWARWLEVGPPRWLREAWHLSNPSRPTDDTGARPYQARSGAVLAAVGLGGILYQVLPIFVYLVLPVPQPRAPSEIRRIIAVLLFGGLCTYGLLLGRGAGELTLGPLAGALVLATILGAARVRS